MMCIISLCCLHQIKYDKLNVNVHLLNCTVDSEEYKLFFKVIETYNLYKYIYNTKAEMHKQLSAVLIHFVSVSLNLILT